MKKSDNTLKVNKKVTTYRILLGVIFSVLILYLFFILPLPYTYQAPGRVINAQDVIKLKNGFHDHKGKIFIPTVVFEQATPVLYLNHILNPSSDFIKISLNNKAMPKARSRITKFEGKALLQSLFLAKTFASRRLGKIETDINTDLFEGSSAGLPIFLELIHQSRKDDITCGKKIAATGQLGIFENLIPVLGVRYKVKGAINEGCTVFICPYDNFKEAEAAADGKIIIIPAKNINKALHELEKLKNLMEDTGDEIYS